MPYRVLVADDEEIERRALERILTREGPPGIEILEAANGAEAIAAAEGLPLDAAFLDIKMPGIDGIEAARRLREASPSLPIIFLTAHDSFEYARSALRLRVEDFLLKPASAAEVVGALSRVLAEARGREGEAREGASKLESAAAYMAEEIRGALAAGRADGEALARHSDLRGGGGALAAVLAIRRLPRDADQPGRVAAAIASLAERALAGEGRFAFAAPVKPAGAAGLAGEVLCAVTAPGEGEGAGEDWLRPSLESLVERIRSELGESVALGAVAPARAGSDSPGAPIDGPGLAKAALRALALAGRSRPVVLLSVAASPPAAEPEAREEGGAGGAAARALELLEARFAEDLSLDAVASELGLSPSHLSRLLGRHTGFGFADCLGRLRVEKAKTFLAGGRISIKEASAMVGFRDPAYFARVFRRFCGMSPAEFRAGGPESRAGGPEFRAGRGARRDLEPPIGDEGGSI